VHFLLVLVEPFISLGSAGKVVLLCLKELGNVGFEKFFIVTQVPL
jgi:hypothetical protein